MEEKNFLRGEGDGGGKNTFKLIKHTYNTFEFFQRRDIFFGAFNIALGNFV